jgi:hypothetical protein
MHIMVKSGITKSWKYLAKVINRSVILRVTTEQLQPLSQLHRMGHIFLLCTTIRTRSELRSRVQWTTGVRLFPARSTATCAGCAREENSDVMSTRY